jgi:type II secretory pathway predicted ATPase ExeA
MASTEQRISHLTASPSLFGLSLGNVEVEKVALSLRSAFEEMCKKGGRGLLITLDEVQDASFNEMRALSVAIQHEIREEGNIAFVFVGLPSMVESVVNGRTLTFLRRAVPVELGPVNLTEVALSMADTMDSSGMNLERGVIDDLAEAARGYPFMIQLVGYHTWQEARRAKTNTIGRDVVERGIAIARGRFDLTVIEPALQRLPRTSLEYVLAMAQDAGQASETGRWPHVWERPRSR